MRLLQTITLQMGEFFANSTIPKFETKQLTGSSHKSGTSPNTQSYPTSVVQMKCLSRIWSGIGCLRTRGRVGRRLRTIASRRAAMGISTFGSMHPASTRLARLNCRRRLIPCSSGIRGRWFVMVYLPDVDMDNGVFYDSDYQAGFFYNHKRAIKNNLWEGNSSLAFGKRES